MSFHARWGLSGGRLFSRTYLHFFLVTLWDYLTQRAEDFTGKESRKTKTSDPSSPNPNKVELAAKWVKMSGFFWPQHC